MAENRLARELDLRDTTQRKQHWARPELLPTPNPEKGYVFRWIRTSIMGQFDPTNTSAKFREGWVPVKAEDHPEMQIFSDPQSRFKDNVEVGGLVLCKAPQEMVDQRNEWYDQQAKSQMDAVDNTLMKTNDPRMPLFNERKSSVSFGKGK
ncbi:MAG: hypothetical protein EBS78_11240 [Altererythrobacter sp.]|jgi:hypothetical protein|nr:hypothetical protein [Altererythrobacter sp.]